MEYLNLIISFIVGGGLSTIINIGITKKSQKIDFAQKAMDFMEGLNDKYTKRIEGLEADVQALLKFKCERPDCANRIPTQL
jgi:hypothetical protein